VNYKLRDWLFSRQHFWGEPFPILHELDDEGNPTGKIIPVPVEQLPVKLPEMGNFKPHGRPEPPWAEAPEEWLYTTIDGRRYRRETNTMPQWAGSCWYYLRYLDPKNDQVLIDPEIEKAWMPVDLYIGGAEHAVLHLLYARFWHKVLFDRGVIAQPEPFQRLINQGMILGEIEMTGFQDKSGAWVSAAEVTTDDATKEPVSKKTAQTLRAVSVEPHLAEKKGEHFVLASDGSIRLNSRSFKMSKSRGNVVNPDAVVKEYGADALRLYEMFMGPLEATKPWNMSGVNGVRGFLDRVWRLIVDDQAESMAVSPDVEDIEPNAEQNRVLHKTIQGVTGDLDNMGFNTAIAKMMEATNFFTKQRPRPRQAMDTLVLLLSPFAPHIAEELWQLLGHDTTLAHEPWPKYDESLIKEDTVEIPVQINGKIRARLNIPSESTREQMEATALADSGIAELLTGKNVVKTIVVPGRLVNFVVK